MAKTRPRTSTTRRTIRGKSTLAKRLKKVNKSKTANTATTTSLQSVPNVEDTSLPARQDGPSSAESNSIVTQETRQLSEGRKKNTSDASNDSPREQNSMKSKSVKHSNDEPSPSESDQSVTDESLMVPPINTGSRGPRQILNVIRDGTSEARDIVLNECNIIFECRLCSNMFRSLPNFMAHKRLYCTDHLCSGMRLFDDTQYDYRSLTETRDRIAAAERDRLRSMSGSGNRLDIEIDPQRQEKRARLDELLFKITADKDAERMNKSSNVPLQIISIPSTNASVCLQTPVDSDLPVWADKYSLENKDQATSNATVPVNGNTSDKSGSPAPSGSESDMDVDHNQGSTTYVIWKCPEVRFCIYKNECCV